MLHVEKISKSFQQRGVVLKDLSIQLKQGDSVSIKGPSGSGKTTLLHIIGSLDKPDNGVVYFNGKSILNFNPDESAEYRNKHVGFVFQDHLLLPYLTIRENILLPLMAKRMESGIYYERERNADELMERLGICNLAGKYPSEVSGGEAQRVAVVRALVNKPDLLLADEPTGSLDSSNAENLGNMLRQINTDLGTTILLATHSDTLARKMERRLILSDGILRNEID